ncbi:SGNH hydrolase [Sparassis crispa]|uniref:SGNH hydrolase n=1 Tax=Sparassis crispa TaxID=139825 RepID=A0A401GKB1_9APHY|nr:SGNH hydrolase [Sparassis crispa]GBE82606.1 SGNH hydrolase [Sparassis crispa]
MAAYVQDVIMLLGDSLTQGGWEAGGFAQRLAFVYNRKLDVLNRGMSGYNTEWIKPVFEQCFANQAQQQHVPKVRLLTIWLGANDAALPPTAQHVPLPKFAANLAELIHAVTNPSSPRYAPATRILLITPPPVGPEQWLAHIRENDPARELDRKFEVTRQYADAVKDVGAREGVPVVDIWTRFWEACGEDVARLSELLTDGLHLNARGYELMFNELIKVVSDKYPELHYDNLPTVFIPFAEIDPTNPRPHLNKREIFGN